MKLSTMTLMFMLCLCVYSSTSKFETLSPENLDLILSSITKIDNPLDRLKWINNSKTIRDQDKKRFSQSYNTILKNDNSKYDFYVYKPNNDDFVEIFMVGENQSYFFYFDTHHYFYDTYNAYYIQEYHTNKKAFYEFPLFYSGDGNTMHFIPMYCPINDFMISGTTIPFDGRFDSSMGRRIAFDPSGKKLQPYANHVDHIYTDTYRNNIFTLGDYVKKLQKIQTEFIYKQKYTSKKPYKYTLNEYTSK